jgi:hypothetical protein
MNSWTKNNIFSFGQVLEIRIFKWSGSAQTLRAWAKCLLYSPVLPVQHYKMKWRLDPKKKVLIKRFLRSNLLTLATLAGVLAGREPLLF